MIPTAHYQCCCCSDNLRTMENLPFDMLSATCQVSIPCYGLFHRQKLHTIWPCALETTLEPPCSFMITCTLPVLGSSIHVPCSLYDSITLLILSKPPIEKCTQSQVVPCIDNRILMDVHYQSMHEYSTICGCTKTSPSYALHFKLRQLEWLALSNQDLVCTSILLVWQWLVYVCSIDFL